MKHTEHEINTSVVYFAPQVKDRLAYSEQCSHLKKVPANNWVFELLVLYQTIDFIADTLYQVWHFRKCGNKLMITCLDHTGSVLQCLQMDSGVYLKDFCDLTLIVKGDTCMLESELKLCISAN